MVSYWRSLQARSVSRRRALGAAGAAGLGGAVVLAGCGRGSSTSPKSLAGGSQVSPGTPKAGGLYQDTPINGNPPHLDLQRTTSVFAQTPVSLVMSRLMQYKVAADPSVGLAAQPTAGVATSVESPDALTWTVKLRPDVKWHNVAPVNGRPFEAEDVKASWTRALTLKDNPFAGAIDMVNAGQITTPEQNTVTFKLNTHSRRFHRCSLRRRSAISSRARRSPGPTTRRSR